MATRISMENPLFAKELLALSAAENSETNAQKLKMIKKALVEVIKNDLTARQKEMVVLYYYKGMQMCEIAALLALDPSTVSRTLTRARANIRKRLKYML